MSEAHEAATDTNRPLNVKEAGSKISELINPKSSETIQLQKQTVQTDDPGKGQRQTVEPRNEEAANQAHDNDESLVVDALENESEEQDFENDNVDEEQDFYDIDLEDTEDNSETEWDESDLIDIPNSDGTSEQVTPDELIQGYMRLQDYTKKTQEVAAARKEIEALQEEVSDLPQVRKRYEESVNHFGQAAHLVLKILDEKFIPKAPDASLLDTDPQAYIVQKEGRQEALNFKSSIVQEMQRAQALEQQELAEQIQKGAQTLQREYAPLRDETQQKDLREYLKTRYGYDDAGIDTNPDHQLFIMAHKAMKYDKIIEKRKNIKPKRKKPKVLKSNKARPEQGTSTQRKRTDAMNRHNKTGSIKSAANAIATGMKAKQAKRRY